ncbi:MAG TPA: ATP-binding cassette domain-containing protein [Candidatus Fimimorpha faecalis]|uniref:ATP-binding cassette domain-containing protein n=1 Tax=Candidatus Fimimorpha faecalis TaxID=2840824 RepID=A0A9D1JCW2_9FIRM|nr:ATP-binding cassette domain-containing protein [Candidatus Fimimorpha faecalis]
MKTVILENVSKQIREQDVLKNINLSFDKGKIFGLIGPNGAGKTTLMRAMMNMISINSGTIQIFNKEYKKDDNYIYARIGALIEEPVFYPYMTGHQNVEYIRKLRKLPKSVLEEIRSLTGLKKAWDKQVKRYSLGMKMRLALGICFMGEPEFLILDEPMNGLDPDGIFTLKELLKKKKEDGVTILISSHLLLELQELADEFIFLKEGEVVKVCENDVNIEDVYNEIYKNREKSL